MNDTATSTNHRLASLGFNFNSLLLTIVTAAIIWVANKTSSNNDTLTEIRTQLPFVNNSVTKLESQISLLVTRAELSSRLSEIDAKNAILDKRLMQLEFEKSPSRKPPPE